MADELRVRVVGLEETRRAFQRLSGKMRGQTLLAGVVAGGWKIVNRAKDRLIANKSYITGTLHRSIHVGGHTELSPDFSASEGYSDIEGEEISADRAQVEAGTNLVYAPRVEYGFSGADSLGRVYNQPAKPYLRPAFDEGQEEVEKEVDRIVGKLIDEAFA